MRLQPTVLLTPASNCVDLTQLSGCDTGVIVPGSGLLTISQTALSGGVATYTYSAASGETPAVGQVVTITGTTNGGGILNVSNATIATLSGTTTGSFTVNGFSTAATLASAPDTGKATIIVPVYDGLSCISQGGTRQLVARTFANNSTSAANNISCLVGPLQFSALTASVATVDANGVATAAQPGSTTITANISQASSNAGFFSTCPPASIQLGVPPNNATSASVNQNTSQPLTTIVTDTHGNPITNLQLEFESTFPITIPAGSNTITPVYPSAAAITAICQPPTCNSAPFDEIGLYGNGTPVTSNPVQITSTGTNFSTVLYIASTQSQYIQPVDFTVTTQPTATRLPYVPSSLVISEDTSTIYMGTPEEIMIFSTLTNALTKQDTSISGNVLAVSPDNTTVVVTDPVRQLVYLYLAAGGVSSEYGGVATSAAWSPDSSTVYITTKDGRLLVHSSFTGWSALPLTSVATDVAVTVPNAGAYLASVPVDVHTNCPTTVVSGTGLTQTTTNTFYPDLGPVAGVNATVLTATNDGAHILTAYSTGGVSTFTDIKTNQKSGGCPVAFTSTPGPAIPLPGAVNNVNNVIATSDSAYAFVTYTTTSTTAGVVPQYAPATGMLTNLTLQQASGKPAPIAPISGVLSGNNSTLYVGTSGDNLVHLLIRGTSGFSDTASPVVPNLPSSTTPGATAPPDLLVERPRKSTS